MSFPHGTISAASATDTLQYISSELMKIIGLNPYLEREDAPALGLLHVISLPQSSSAEPEPRFAALRAIDSRNTGNEHKPTVAETILH